MTEKTARKYRDDERLPSERKTARNYRTRVDPFEDVWAEVQRKLAGEPALKAVTLFEWLQQTDPGRFPDSTRRTFERRVAQWRSLYGPGQTVFFSQIHHPGRLAASDFTVCNELGVKIAGERFDHTLFHCVLTYSNVESVSLCFSESFEALIATSSIRWFASRARLRTISIARKCFPPAGSASLTTCSATTMLRRWPTRCPCRFWRLPRAPLSI